MPISVPGCPLVADSGDRTSQALTPNMIRNWIDVRAIRWPGVFVNDVRTVSLLQGTAESFLQHAPVLGQLNCWPRNW